MLVSGHWDYGLAVWLENEAWIPKMQIIKNIELDNWQKHFKMAEWTSKELTELGLVFLSRI